MARPRGPSQLLLPLTLVAVLIATVVLTVRDHQAAVDAHADETDAALSLAASRVEEAVDRGVVAVDGVASLFAASQQVEADEFATYTTAASNRGDLLPGVTAFAWAVTVAADDVATFEREVLDRIPADLRAVPDPVIRPPVTDGDAIVVALAHRLDGAPSNAQGFALSSSADRLAALEQAASTGRTIATAPLELISGTTGLLLARAVEAGDGSVDGWAVLAIEATPFLASVALDDRITVRLLDDATGRPVVDDGPGVTPAGTDLADAPTTTIEVAGQTWTMAATPTTEPPSLLTAGALPGRLLPLLLVGGVIVLVERERREKLRSLEAAAAAEREAAAREQELATTQRRLLSTVSHELRTPLTSIIGFGSLLVDELTDDQQLQRFATRISANAVVLKDLVDDLLAFSRLERGEFTLLPETLDLAQLTRNTLHAIEPILDSHDVRLTASSVLASVDETAFRRVVTNLVENAVRYGGCGPVDVVVGVEDDHATLHVDDRGDGVAVEQREHVFVRFERGTAGLATNSSGTGLGLAVVRGLTEAMGGTATVGDAPTGGARFSVRLPLVHDDDPSDMTESAATPGGTPTTVLQETR